MATFFYVIVPYSGAKKLGLDEIREKLSNGCYLLTQKDLISLEGKTLFERAGQIGGAIVSEGEAIQIKNGVIPVPIENDLPEEKQESQFIPEEITPEVIEPETPEDISQPEGNSESEKVENEEEENE